MQLSEAQHDRARGALLGAAAGDALGAPYEFEPPRPPELTVEMSGGGGFGWAPGEWTDDTAMAVAIAEVAADGVDLRDPDAQTRIVRRWRDWALAAPDVGNQTRAVLGTLGPDSTGADARSAATALHERTGRTGGNGSLMRTAPVALAYLDDPDALAEAAAAISALTHVDPDAQDACVLWCLAIRHAVLSGELDVRAGLNHVGPRWAGLLDAAEHGAPASFPNNGWVVTALQAAWSAIHRAPDLPSGLDAAVRAGDDTDTVAAIAGALLGAVRGASAVPDDWRGLLHGWPGLDAAGLTGLVDRIVTAHDDPAFRR